MKYLITCISAFYICVNCHSQATKEEVELLRKEHKEHLSDTAYGYLNLEEIEHFEGLDYFPFDESFQIKAKFTKKKGRSFEMPTSTDRKPWYRRYGYLDFEVNGVQCRLEVYQNLALKQSKEHKHHLFLPMRDKTSAKTSYGGGRFLDLTIPKDEFLIIDFNLLYNPYCAYSDRYSCPIPPAVNTLNVAILAGEKTPHGH